MCEANSFLEILGIMFDFTPSTIKMILKCRTYIYITLFTQRRNMETYYNPMDLSKFGDIGEEAPEMAKKFFEYYGSVFAEGELTEREKALIALAVAHAVQCPYCIDAYTSTCLEKGSNQAEMTEAVHVSCAIRGGASLVHGVQMMNNCKKVSM